MAGFALSRRLAGGILLLTSISGAAAGSIQDKFQGVWAAAGIPCDKIFTKKRGNISFVRFYGAKAPGLIVKGDKVQGSQAVCKLVSMKKPRTLSQPYLVAAKKSFSTK